MSNCCAAGEHVPEIERYIHTLKDRAQGVIQEPAMGTPSTSPEELHPLAECIPSHRWGVQHTFPMFSADGLGVVI